MTFIGKLDADTGVPLASAALQTQGRMVEADLARGRVWLYGQGRLRQFDGDVNALLDIQLPLSGGGNGNGGEIQLDIAVELATGVLWLGLKRQLSRIDTDGVILSQDTADSDIGAVVLLTIVRGNDLSRRSLI